MTFHKLIKYNLITKQYNLLDQLPWHS